MLNKIKAYNRIVSILVFIGLPLLFWALGDIPRRSTLKEAISVLTLVAFSLMLGQFYLARSNRQILKEHKMNKVINWHKVIGYILVPLLLFHPFLIAIPRYFESGIEPNEAFIKILTTFDNQGIVLGISAWCLMFVLGLTSFFRKLIPLSYKTWRIIHGILSVCFIATATWHVLKLGRHIDTAMTVFILIVATGGVILLLQTYSLPSIKKA
jgi:predicted ferric reductase